MAAHVKRGDCGRVKPESNCPLDQISCEMFCLSGSILRELRVASSDSGNDISYMYVPLDATPIA